MGKILFLGIDTSQTEASLCIASNETVLCALSFSLQKKQLEKLIPSLQWMLAQTGLTQNDIAAVGVTTGGGSFTGLRLGISTAKALAYALKIPLVGIPTLDAYVQSAASHPGMYMPLLDVRKKQVYGAVYKVYADSGGLSGLRIEKYVDDFICRVDEITAKLPPETANDGVVIFGSALETYADELRKFLPHSVYVKHPCANVAKAVALYTRRKFMQGKADGDAFSVSLTYTHTP